MSSVDVYILPDGGNLELVKTYFTNSAFNVINDALPFPEGVTTESQISSALIYSKSTSPENSCILIKDTSISTHSPETIAEIVLTGSAIASQLFYLCKWNDLCNLYKASELDPRIYKTYSPGGFQAVLFTPTGRDIYLGDTPMRNGVYFNLPPNVPVDEFLSLQITEGNIDAVCTTPNLFDYDAMKYASAAQEFSRLNECRFMTRNSGKGVSPHTYLYVAGIILLIFIFGLGMYKMGPDVRKFASEKAALRERVSVPVIYAPT